MNAKRLITTWGGSLNDYACRNWNGLMWNYYAKRWEIYIRNITAAILGNADFDNDSFRAAADKLQEKWVTTKDDDIVQTEIDSDVLTHCRELREKYRKQLDNYSE